jgi:short-subunit dehydrogenase
MTSFRNKIVLVTGGAAGIGKLLGERSLQEGAAELIIWDLDAKGLKHTVSDLRARGFSNIHAFELDVADVNSVEAAATRVLLEIGNVDMIFNNAGIIVGKKFREHSAADIERTIATNLTGYMHVARVFLPDMLRQGSGHIVNISSASALIGSPKMSVYAASKWAVLGWSESLRLELEREKGDLHVTTICPGYVDTAMAAGVKVPFLTPLLKPAAVVDKIVKAVKKNETLLMMPEVVNLVPLLKGVLPTRVFDFIAEKLGVYHSMDGFSGHGKTSSTKKIRVD